MTKGFADVHQHLVCGVDDGLIDAVATDAHNVDTRPIRMMEAYRVLEDQYGAAYAERLTGLDGVLVFSCSRS